MQATTNGENAWRAPGGVSQSNNGLRASAPIWTPKQKNATKSATNAPVVETTTAGYNSVNFNSVNSSETVLIPQKAGGWSNNSWSGSVSPMSHHPMMQSMAMMPNGMQGGGSSVVGSVPLSGGSSPSSPGTGVFLPSSLGRRPSQGGSGSGSGNAGGFLHGSSPPRRFNLAVNHHDSVGVSHISTTQCHNSAISLPDELF